MLLFPALTFFVTRLFQLQSLPIALGTDHPPFFVFLTEPIVVKAVLLSSPFTRLVVAAPHLGRLVEDLSSAFTLGLSSTCHPSHPDNARVSTSKCKRPFTSVPGKCVVEVEEEEQNNQGSADHHCLKMNSFGFFFLCF